MHARSKVLRDELATIETLLDVTDARAVRSLFQELVGRSSATDRAWVIDELLRRARREMPGWQPPTSDPNLRADVADCMRRKGRYVIDPAAVDHLLRRASRALLAGDPAASRSAYDELLPALLDGELSLQYDEQLDEVLEIDLADAALCWLAATYLTTPLAERAQALIRVLEDACRAAPVTGVIEGMQRVSGHALTDIQEFLPSWIEALHDVSQDQTWFDISGVRREAILHHQGVDGLGRHAKRTKLPDDYRAWIDALVATERWRDAYTAVVGTARQLKKLHQAAFFDAAAMLAPGVGEEPRKHLEAAWRASPTVARFLRLIGHENSDAEEIRKRALRASKNIRPSARLDAVIAIATGNVARLMSLLETAPALGWSGDHPGWIAFPALVRIVGGVTSAGTARHTVCGALDTTDDGFMEPLDELEYAVLDPFGGPRSLPSTPPMSLETLTDCLEIEVDSATRRAICAVLRRAVERRLGGILKNKRRRHYDSVATMVACCVELDERSDAWLARVRDQGRRYPAFRSALESALGGSHLTVSASVSSQYPSDW